MAKKAAPKKTKMAAKPTKKTAPKKVAPAKKTATAAKASASKASLKSGAKKDVKLSAGKKAGAPTMSKAEAAKATKKDTVKGAVELKVKATAAPAPATPAPTGKAAKAPKGAKKAATPKNYEDMCREIACESHSSTAGYCRLHYIKNWKKIKRKELILREKKLNQYIEELVSKYPDKYIEAIKQDLADETAFSKVIYDLELDEGVDDIPTDDESDEQVIDSIKREFDDGDTEF
ncbi:MAG: hypothetical protein JST04_09445 [Bdellovibrionales bacterium]|nr:hypothetical protein [Bdellovibrionales bacterium]